MAWTDFIPAIIGAAGALADRGSAKSPKVPDPLDYQQIINLMMQDSTSPWGSSSYSEGPDGRFTRSYELSPEVQPIFDRGVSRSLNPDQSYQLPPQLRQLQQALMNSRLQGMGVTPDTNYQPPGGGQSQPNFTQAGVNAPVGSNSQPIDSLSRQPIPAGSRERSSEGGYGYSSDAGYAPQLSDPMGSRNQSFNDKLNNMIPPAPQGTDPGAWERFWVEHGGQVGGGLAGSFGPTGAGMAAKTGINALIDQFYWGGNQWKSPANLPPTLNETVNQLVDDSPFNMGNLGAQNSGGGEGGGAGAGGGGRSFGSPAFGSGGPWYNDGRGGFQFSYSGHPYGGDQVFALRWVKG